MKKLLQLLLVAAAVVCGCKKQEAKPNAEAGTVTSDSPPVTEPARAEPAAVVDSSSPASSAKPIPPPPLYVAARADNHLRQNVIGEPDAFLTGQLRAFMQKQGRLPESFAEFVNARLDSVPRPPEGKRWVIDIDDMQVKAVSSR